MTSQFGNVSDDYAKYRDALPQVLFNQLIDQGVFFAGNQIIELGAGTGIISRDLAMLGAHVIGIEPSPQMIVQAERSVLGTSAGSVRYICAAAESFEVDHRVPIMIAVRAWHWFDRTKTLQNIDKHLTEDGILIIINSIFRSDSDIAQLTFGVLQDHGIEMKPAGSHSSTSLRRNGFPVDWFGEWEQHQFQVVAEWQYEYALPYSHDAWCGKIRSVSWLTDIEEDVRMHVTADLMGRLQGCAALLHIPHQASMVVLRKR